MTPADVDLDDLDEDEASSASLYKPLTASQRRSNWIDQRRDTFWPLIWLVFNLGLVIVGGLMMGPLGHPGWAVIPIVWGTLGLAGEGVRALAQQTSAALVDIRSEQQCATHTAVSIDVERVLGHRSLARAFSRLQALRRIPPEQDFEKWRDALMARYRERSKTSPADRAWISIEFQFNGGEFTVNKEPMRFPILDHQTLIPDPALKRHGSFSQEEELAYDGVRVRLVVLNGLLKVQLGRWDKALGHPGKHSDRWVAWDTVTRFPLILCAFHHSFPPRFLLLDYFYGPSKRRPWEPTMKNFWLLVSDYRRDLGTDVVQMPLFDRMGRAFQEWLHKEGFKPVQFPKHTWENEYMRVQFTAQPDRSELYRLLSDEDRDPPPF